MGGSPGPTFEVPHEACPGRCRSCAAHRVQLVAAPPRRRGGAHAEHYAAVGEHRRGSKPKRVIAWGGSLGGIITAGLIQLYPDRFAGAIPLCGVLAGGVATWNAGLDGAYAFKTLLAPTSSLRLVNIA